MRERGGLTIITRHGKKNSRRENSATSSFFRPLHPSLKKIMKRNIVEDVINEVVVKDASSLLSSKLPVIKKDLLEKGLETYIPCIKEIGESLLKCRDWLKKRNPPSLRSNNPVFLSIHEESEVMTFWVIDGEGSLFWFMELNTANSEETEVTTIRTTNERALKIIDMIKSHFPKSNSLKFDTDDGDELDDCQVKM